MDMTGEQRIPATREVVWRALNDPEILKLCIPGCQKLEKTSDTNMTAIAVIRVGPISARFEGAVTLSDLDPPAGCRISGEGQGGVAGFAKGDALVRLESDQNETVLRYAVKAQVGGKLAQLGSRLIDATAKQMSAAFFTRFAEEISARARGDQPVSVQQTPASTRLQSFGASQIMLMTLAIATLAAAAAAFFGRSNFASATPAGGVSSDLASAVILILVAAVSYLFGRLNKAGQAVVIDRDLLEKLRTFRSDQSSK